MTRKKRTHSRLEKQEHRAAFFFLLPSFVLFMVFTVISFSASFVLSFFDWDLITTPHFVGFHNYIELMNDPLFRKVLFNTLYFTALTVPLSALVGLIIALGLNQKIKGVAIYRTVYFMPAVTSLVAVSLLWQWIFDGNYGLLNNILSILGVSHPPQWLSSTEWAMPALIIMSVWTNSGMTMVLFLAGLQNISQHLYEAAAIDGASKFKKFLYITLPVLTPTTFFVLVITTIHSFQVFTQALIMTKGGPADATNTIVYFIYQNGFEYFKMGYASAAAWVLFTIIFVFTLIQMKLQKNWVHY
ncbi:carbohydrate ABC transporter permease [Novibacillus thermophilus]|uniref:carbohydrate ABC transporter permease n=1 Tax=Novibacillus thermophilus TaxID=1471761 RepID=UPI00098B15C7|nr:sugar ABC transporter permease [Novibacillus thermophilus]